MIFTDSQVNKLVLNRNPSMQKYNQPRINASCHFAKIFSQTGTDY